METGATVNFNQEAEVRMAVAMELHRWFYKRLGESLHETINHRGSHWAGHLLSLSLAEGTQNSLNRILYTLKSRRQKGEYKQFLREWTKNQSNQATQ